MSAQSIILRQTIDGWSVCLTGGRVLADFHGFGARWRARRWMAGFLGSL